MPLGIVRVMIIHKMFMYDIRGWLAWTIDRKLLLKTLDYVASMIKIAEFLQKTFNGLL